MKKLALLSAFALIAVPAFAGAGLPGTSNHPDAVCTGVANPSGNDVCCVTSGTTGTTMCLNNVDAPGVGFNDTTAAAPIDGNPGTTVGQQRVNGYMEAFRVWTDTVTSSETIIVQGSLQPLACTATGGVLGSASTIQIFADFDDDGGPSWPTTWYHGALANKLAAEDLAPGPFDAHLAFDPLATTFNDDIATQFNGNLGNTGCLEGLFWYYGFTGGEDPNTDIDFLQVVTHEVGHGMGHANFIDEDGFPSGCFSSGTCVSPPGSGPLGWPDIYTVYSRDWNTGTHWNQMSDGQRFQSGIGDELVWDGPNVWAAAPSVLGPGVAVRENSPTSQSFRAQAAEWPPAPTAGGLTGDLAYWTEDVDSSGDPHDGCAITIDTGASCDPGIIGKIALMNRGSCTFVEKAIIAEVCGATGLVVANNVPAGLPGMGGSPFGGSIVAVGIAQSAGDALKADLLGGPVNVTILEDAATLAGADRGGFPRLYAPNPVAPGSSVSHWDTTLTPNALMEPFINADLDVGTTMDLTPAQMMDIGWNGAINCPVDSDDSATVVIDGCDTGVSNDFGPWTFVGAPKGKGWKTTSGTTYGGCYIADLVAGCVNQTLDHSRFASCVDQVANLLRKSGAISPSDSNAIKACAESADLP